MSFSPPSHAWRQDPKEVKGQSVDRAMVRRVLAFTMPYKAQIIRFLIAVVIGSLLAVIPPFLFGHLIDDGIQKGDQGVVTRLALLAIVVTVASMIASLVQRFYSARIGEGLIFDLRVTVFDHIQRLPLAFFTRSQTGALVSRLNNDVIGAQRAVTSTLSTVASNFFSIVVTVPAMLLLDWRLTLITLAVLPLFVILARRVGQHLAGTTRRGMELNATLNTMMTERFNVSGALLVKLFGSHDTERDEFAGKAEQVAQVGVETAMYMRILFAAMTLITALGTALTYWFGGRFAIQGTLQPGDVVTFAALVTQVYRPLSEITNARVEVMTALVSFDRVFEMLDIPNPIDEPAQPAAIDHIDGAIEFRDVSFRYPKAQDATIASVSDVHEPESLVEDWALRHVSFTAAAGETVALVGPSGAGKSTLTNLLPRIYDTIEGEVLVDGHDVRTLSLELLRNNVGVVTQDPHLFHDTITNNLLYAKPEATTEEIVEACRKARILDLIRSLPNGFDTVVGERGYRMSGGEKQRLAIARVFLKDPAIVILDEATSHLDSESEAAIQDAFEAALDQRTSLVIAHRLSTIVNADQILVVVDGQIVERGTHEDVLDMAGVYADLYQTQFGGRRLSGDNAAPAAPADGR
ncbi:MAG: ABC transporter ATP-binding protein [Acidimicrobiia bacterium]|nr:ABC transporter ATP-binding protein [Acidimicrobiia bacterium]